MRATLVAIVGAALASADEEHMTPTGSTRTRPWLVPAVSFAFVAEAGLFLPTQFGAERLVAGEDERFCVPARHMVL